MCKQNRYHGYTEEKDMESMIRSAINSMKSEPCAPRMRRDDQSYFDFVQEGIDLLSENERRMIKNALNM